MQNNTQKPVFVVNTLADLRHPDAPLFVPSFFDPNSEEFKTCYIRFITQAQAVPMAILDQIFDIGVQATSTEALEGLDFKQILDYSKVVFAWANNGHLKDYEIEAIEENLAEDIITVDGYPDYRIKLFVTSSDGGGFIYVEDDTRAKGNLSLVIDEDNSARFCIYGDTIKIPNLDTTNEFVSIEFEGRFETLKGVIPYLYQTEMQNGSKFDTDINLSIDSVIDTAYLNLLSDDSELIKLGCEIFVGEDVRQTIFSALSNIPRYGKGVAVSIVNNILSEKEIHLDIVLELERAKMLAGIITNLIEHTLAHINKVDTVVNEEASEPVVKIK